MMKYCIWETTSSVSFRQGLPLTPTTLTQNFKIAEFPHVDTNCSFKSS